MSISAGASPFASKTSIIRSPTFSVSSPLHAPPRTLAELNSRATEEVAWDPKQKPAKWYREACNYHQLARHAEARGDYETMWIEMVKAFEILRRLKLRQDFETTFTHMQIEGMRKVSAFFN